MRRLARWACFTFGNLAVRLAPYAGVDLVFRVGRPKPMAGGIVQRRTQVFDLVCNQCYEVEWMHGASGVEALDRTCGACGARDWRVKPHAEHTASRKVDP